MFPSKYFRCAKNYFLLAQSCHRLMAMATPEPSGEAAKRTHCRGIGIDKSLCRCCQRWRLEDGEHLFLCNQIVEADEQASSNAMSPTLPPVPNTSAGPLRCRGDNGVVWYFVLRARLTGIGPLEAGFLLWPPIA
jgi:hypothetical protein